MVSRCPDALQKDRVVPDDDIVRSQAGLVFRCVDIETAIDLVQITQPDNPACGRRFRPGAGDARSLEMGYHFLSFFLKPERAIRPEPMRIRVVGSGTGAGSGSYKAVPALALSVIQPLSP